MAACSAVKRSVLDVDGKSFDVILSHTSLSWGHVGIEDSGLGKKIKYFCNVFNMYERASPSSNLKASISCFKCCYVHRGLQILLANCDYNVKFVK